MAHTSRKRKKTKRPSTRRSRRYTAVELVIAGIGALMLVIAIGMIISSVFSG